MEEGKPGKRKKGKLAVTRSARCDPWEPSERELQVYAEICRGATQEQAAEKFGVGRFAVLELVKRVNGWFFLHRVEDVREIKAQQTESLLYIFRESMAAWEKSKRPAVTIKIEPGPLGKRVIRQERKFQVGNSAYLDQARAALREIREIWGANAPVKVEHSGELRVAGMTVEDANRQLAEQLEAARGKLLETTTVAVESGAGMVEAGSS